MIGLHLLLALVGSSGEASNSVVCSSLTSKSRGDDAPLSEKPHIEVILNPRKKDCERWLSIQLRKVHDFFLIQKFTSQVRCRHEENCAQQQKLHTNKRSGTPPWNTVRFTAWFSVVSRLRYRFPGASSLLLSSLSSGFVSPDGSSPEM